MKYSYDEQRKMDNKKLLKSGFTSELKKSGNRIGEFAIDALLFLLALVIACVSSNVVDTDFHGFEPIVFLVSLVFLMTLKRIISKRMIRS